MSIRLIKNATHFQIYQAFNVSSSHAKPLGRKNDKESGSELDDVPAGLGTLRLVPAFPGELRTYILFIILVPLDGLLDPVRERRSRHIAYQALHCRDLLPWAVPGHGVRLKDSLHPITQIARYYQWYLSSFQISLYSRCNGHEGLPGPSKPVEQAYNAEHVARKAPILLLKIYYVHRPQSNPHCYYTFDNSQCT